MRTLKVNYVKHLVFMNLYKKLTQSVYFKNICDSWNGNLPTKEQPLLEITDSIQKQPSRGVLRKRYSKNMRQIYRKIFMPKCFNY